MNTTEMKFAFYLDAVHYCRQRSIDLNKIFRLDWKTWCIKV